MPLDANTKASILKDAINQKVATLDQKKRDLVGLDTAPMSEAEAASTLSTLLPDTNISTELPAKLMLNKYIDAERQSLVPTFERPAGDARTTMLEDLPMIEAQRAKEERGLQIPQAIASGTVNLGSRIVEIGGEGIQSIGEWQDWYNKRHGGGSSFEKGFAQVLTDVGGSLQQEQRQFREAGGFDKFIGYDPQDVQSYGARFADSILQGNYGDAIVGLFSPEALTATVQSLPEMGVMANPAGLMTVIGANVNTNLNALEENAKKNGIELTASDKAMSAALSTVGTLLDRLGDKAALSSSKGLRAMIDSLPKAITDKVFSIFGERLAKIGITVASLAPKAAVEGATEGAQTILEEKASNVDQMNLTLTDDEIRKALEATGIGMGAGGTVAGTVSTGEVATEVIQGAKDKARDVLAEKYKTMGEKGMKEAEQVSTSTETPVEEAPVTQYKAPDEEPVVPTIDDTITNLQTDLKDPETTNEQRKVIQEDLRKAKETKNKETLLKQKAMYKQALDMIDMTGMTDEQVKKAKKNAMKAVQRIYPRLIDIVDFTDRKKAVNIEPITDVQTVEQGGKKPKTFDPYNVNEDVINDVVEGAFTEQSMSKLSTVDSSKLGEREVKKLKHGSKTQKAIKAVHSVIAEQNAKPEIQAKLKDIVGEDADLNARGLRIASLVLSGVQSAITAESDIRSNAGLKQTGKGESRTLGLNVQLGKDYFNSYGMRLRGDEEATATAYAKVGNQLLDYVQSLGLINIEEGNVPAQEMVTPENESVSTLQGYQELGTGEAKLRPSEEVNKYGNKVIMLRDKVVTLTDATVTQRGVQSANGEAMTTLSRLLKPTNYQAPSAMPTNVVPTDRAVSEEHKKIIQDMNELSYKLKPEFISLLKDVKRIVASYGSIDQAFAKDPNIQKLLSITDLDTKFTKRSEEGRNRSRKDILRDILDNLEDLEYMSMEDGFHYNYESAINQRIHVMQTILEFQGDKRMSRQMITGGEYTTTAKGAQVLMENLADEELKKITIDDLRSNNLPSSLIDMFKQYNATKNVDVATVMEIAQEMSKHMKKTDNPFKALSVFRALNDIYMSSDKDNITTDYMVEYDATASGVVNTLMNLAGNKKVQNVLDQLINKGVDPYSHHNNVFKAYLKETPAVAAKVNPILKALAKVGLDERTLAKAPVMTTFYGQYWGNTSELLADSIAKDLLTASIDGYDQNAVDLINSVLDTDYTIDQTSEADTRTLVKDISQKDINTLVKFFKNNFTDIYVQRLSESFPGVNEYRTTMGKIYDLLEKSGQWDGTIESAMSKMLPDGQMHSMSLRKMKMTLAQNAVENSPVLVNKKMNNRTSFFVNLQHATDAAQLLLTMKEALDKGLSYGTMTVHDAIYGNANKMLGMKKSYENLISKAAMEYDYVQVALEELNRTIQKMPEGRLKNSYVEQYNDMLVTNKELFSTKEQFLKSIKTNFFGSKTLAETTKATVDTVTQLKQDLKAAKAKDFANRILKVVASSKATFKDNLKSFVSDLDVKETHTVLQEKVVNALAGDLSVFKSSEFSGAHGKIYVSTTMRTDPRTNKAMTPEALVEIMAHEIDHAYSFEYIRNNMNSGEIKYIMRALNELKRVNPNSVSRETLARISYILEPFGTNNGKLERAAEALGVTPEEALPMYQVSEFISVMRNEPNVVEDLHLTKAKKAGILAAIQRFIDKVIKYLKTMTSEERSALFDADTKTTLANTVKAMETVMLNAKVYGAGSKSEDIVAPSIGKALNYDLYKDMYKNPYKYADNLIAKQNIWLSLLITTYGEAIVDTVAPVAKVAHVKARRKYSIYRGVTNLIRAGFYDSKLAHEMKALLTNERDVDDVLMNQLLSMGDAIQQSSKQILTNDLKQLDDRILNFYPEESDRTRLYEIFSRTGIAGLRNHKTLFDDIVSGKRSLREGIILLSAESTTEEIATIKDVADYYTSGIAKNGFTNLSKAGLYKDSQHALAALFALNNIDGSIEMLQTMDKELRNELFVYANVARNLSEQVNEQEVSYKGRFMEMNAVYDIEYDGHYTMDVFENQYEYRTVTKYDLRNDRYSKDDDWIVVKEPTTDTIGIVARKLIDASRTPGIGLNANKFKNGFYLDEEESQILARRLAAMKDDQERKDFMESNQIIKDNNNRYRFLLDYKATTEKLGMMQNVAHSMMRTIVHNKELIEMASVREVVMNEATNVINNIDELYKVVEDIKFNEKKNREEEIVQLPMFLNITYDYRFDDLPPAIKKMYEAPRNLSTYNNFNRNISLVKKSESTALLGHKNFSIFGKEGNRQLAKAENAWKKFVAHAKQMMVVANFPKLAVDFVSNVSILGTKDVSPMEMGAGFKEGWKYYNEFSKMRGDLVIEEMKILSGDKGAAARAEKIKKALTKHPFYDAFNYGFIQSYSTDLVVKDFDTISGLQKDIDDLIESITKDKNGNPNEIYKAIKWWQSFGASKGFSVDSLFRAASKLSVLNGTTMQTEMVHLADRLKSKRDAESVARYVGDVLGSPASEVVTIGGATMVTMDALSKYVLAKHLIGKPNPRTKFRTKYTVEEAYMEANRTFIDYRRNLPPAVKALSDYGILMFPAFWMKVQRVIYNLLRYNPSTAIGSYMIADLLEANGANILDVNIIKKVMDGQVVNDPISIVDWDNISIFT